MAVGAVAPSGRGREFDGRITFAVCMTCVVAATGGLIFGYDIGISGGVTTMEPFLQSFFPFVLKQMSMAKARDGYCMFNSQLLTAFTSSIFIAGLAASFGAGKVTRAFGRRASMLFGGIAFLLGSFISAGAIHIAMLIVGRLLLGFGVGFINQSAPVYISEMAPSQWRGAFVMGFQLCVTIGVIVASVVNYYVAQLRIAGWRLSLGIGAVPAIILVTCSLFIPDTASSLMQRGRVQDARTALQRVRGPDVDIDAEIQALAEEGKKFQAAEKPFRNMLSRRYRPQLVMSIAIPFFQQLSGVNIIAFYSPVLLQSVGLENGSALLGAVVLGLVSLVAVFISSYAVDRYGRRILFIEGGLQMMFSYAAIACVLGLSTARSGTSALTKNQATLVLIFMCSFSASFGWSWGTLSWVIPSEIFPLEIRPAGQSISVAINFGTTFILAQLFLAMLCNFKYWIFVFYVVWIMIMTIFIAVFLPETKGLPLEDVNKVWAQHWYWKRFVTPEQLGPSDTAKK
ncbi:sugar transport protein MST3-like [Nymphaea colorata]|nr:sugar transport protein MST3-like [Nymphaea colorata]